jgi:hypothetical protein
LEGSTALMTPVISVILSRYPVTFQVVHPQIPLTQDATVSEIAMQKLSVYLTVTIRVS